MSFDKLNNNTSNSDEFSFNKEKKVIKKNKNKEDIYKSLGNNKRWVMLKIEEHIFEPKYKNDKDDYF